MRIHELLARWDTDNPSNQNHKSMTLNLPIGDMARLQALADLYPGESVETLARDLISAALYEVESSFPYIKGSRVIAEDEQGAPIYEDEGLTPRFLALTRHYLKEWQRGSPMNGATTESQMLYPRQ